MWGPSLYYLAIALGMVAGGIAFWVMSFPSSGGRDSVAASPAVASSAAPSVPASSAAAASSSAPASPVRMAAAKRRAPEPETAVAQPPPTQEEGSDPTTGISVFVNPGEVPTMAEVIERLHQAGVHSGLGAFSPPGTRPPLVGLAVPEDFVLPEGYVRHYQATDDGQRIEPILRFSPDYEVVDASGRPIEIGEDRVVPPELAPPGLPMRHIVIPEPPAPGRPRR
jgi:hypothetical protein